jgi:hypothetical protein
MHGVSTHPVPCRFLFNYESFGATVISADTCHERVCLEAYVTAHHPGGRIDQGSVYKDAHSKMGFFDAAGNRFELTPKRVLSGGWSPFETGRVRDPEWHMAELRTIAESRGGRIADGSVYVTSHTKMAFIDAAGNRFVATPNNVKNGTWSPFEAKRVRDPKWHMAELRTIAKSRGGRIAAGAVYVDARTKLAFVDAAGNAFEMAPSAVKKGAWSPFESGTVKDPKWHTAELAAIAEARGGRIAKGSVYVGSHVKMAFVGHDGNRFEMTPSSVKEGHWSPYEANKVWDPAWHMAELDRLARLRGGAVAPGSVYAYADVKMTFIDVCRNRFEMTPSAVKSGHWSPFEYIREGARVQVSDRGKMRSVFLETGEKVVYLIQAGGGLCIHKHVTADGNTVRWWTWLNGVATIKTTTKGPARKPLLDVPLVQAA